MGESIKDIVLLLTDEAKADIIEIAGWYEKQRVGLGNEFILNLEAAFSKIIRHPFLYTEKQNGTRQVLTQRFPYRVVYFMDSNVCVVYGIVHTSRNPTTWKNRMPKK